MRKIRIHSKSQDNLAARFQYMSLAIAIGLSSGISFGLSLGIALENTAAGLSIGMSLGICLGAVIGNAIAYNTTRTLAREKRKLFPRNN